MTAPGGMDHHYGVVAATPALLAYATALAVLCVGSGRGGRVLAAVGLIPALALQTVLLAPEGIAWRCRGLHVNGAIFVDPITITAGLVLALVVAARGDPWRGTDRHPAAWCLRIGTALALPTLLIPALVLAVEHDHPQRIEYRPLRIGVALLATVGWLWWPLPCALAMLILVALTTRGAWRWVTAISAVALGTAALV